MNPRPRYDPRLFFLIAYLITWSVWFTDAYFSWHGGSEGLLGLLMLLGLSGPFVAAIIMLLRAGSPELWRDYRNRLTRLSLIDLRTLPLILFLIPAVICVAIAISLIFGGSPDQFAILLAPSFMTIPSLIGVVLAPAFEEAGWRGYGMDALRSRSTLFAASLSFALLWAFWHTPLFFINGFYHNGLLTSWLYTANFFVGVVAMAFIINWLYYRNNRSIVACFLFHLSANVAMSVIPAEPFTKCIVTLLMLVIAGVIILLDRNLFFDLAVPELPRENPVPEGGRSGA